MAVASSIQNTKLFTWRTWPGAGAVPKCDWAARSQCGFKQRRADHTKYTVVKRTRVPAGYLVKMATDADVDSGRKMTLLQSIEAYTWNVLSGKIHGGIRNIQCKSRLRGTFHRCTIAPRKNIFWRECFVFMFCRCRGYLYFFTRVPGIFTRVPALYKGAWFVSHFHYRVFHRTLAAHTTQQTCEREFCNEELCFMSEQLRCIHLILCEIAGTS